jgi:hypothetical protein
MEAECQTKIGMEYFETEPQVPLSKADSRASGNSNKQRVGGGGSMVKPPKPVSKQPSSNIEPPLKIAGNSNNPSQASHRGASNMSGS